MTDREFLGQVRERASLADERSARQVAEGVIRQLVGRLTWGQKHDLAALLPPRLGRFALAAANTDLAYAPARTFLRDLSDELLVDSEEARRLAQAVAAVLMDLLPADERRDMRAQLHAVYQAVFV